MLCHLRETLQGEGTAAAGQLFERMSVREALDTEAVARVQLLLQEFGTRVPQSDDVEEAGGLEEELDVVRGDASAARVNVLQERVHGVRLDAVDLHKHLSALPMVVAEHGTEVAAACRQHGAVTGKLATLDADDHVREEAAVSELVEDLEDGLGVRRSGREVVNLVQVLGVHLKDFTLDCRRFWHAAGVLMIQTATQNEHHDFI